LNRMYSWIGCMLEMESSQTTSVDKAITWI
jgi:hypothetical protein